MSRLLTPGDAIELPWLLLLAVVLPLVLVLLLRRARVQRAQRLAAARDARRRASPRAGDRVQHQRRVARGAARPRQRCSPASRSPARAGAWSGRSCVRRGIDLVLAVDASLSMMATDERPNRLERMKQEVRRLRALSPGRPRRAARVRRPQLRAVAADRRRRRARPVPRQSRSDASSVRREARSRGRSRRASTCSRSRRVARIARSSS